MGCCRCDSAEFFCHVLLLDETEFPIEIRKTTKGQEILDKVFLHLNLLEKDYFGLRYIDQTSQSRWLDPLKSVIKQLKSGPPYLLYFCVKFYPADPCRLHEEITRYQVFLQVKKDIYQGRLPCTGNLLADLSAYVLQSELGDYDPHVHVGNYASEFRFIPNQSEELERRIAGVHEKIGGLVPAVAEFMYLDKVKWMEMYGVDLHPAKGDDLVEYFLAVKPSGVAVYKNKTKVGSYNWVRIQKLDFKGKKFYLTVKGKEDVENTYKFFLPSKAAAKHLWKCSLEHHAFFRLEKLSDTSRRGSFSGLFRTGSGFRYSGRTQKEVLEESRRIDRRSPDVRRKPSKRYEKRNSQSNEKAHSTTVAASVASMSQVQVRHVSQGPGAYNETGPEVVTVPVRGPTGTVTETHGDPTSVDGSTTAEQSIRGPALPWEQSVQNQGGLYTPAPDSPGALKSSGSGRSRGRSPKFPRPRRRSAGPSSGSETDIPSRRRSRAAYSSDEDSGRRRRKRCRHRRHGAHSADSASDRDTPSRGGRRHQRALSEPEDFTKLPDSAPYHWNGKVKKQQGGSSDERSHRKHKYRSDGDARSDGSSRHRHSRLSDRADSEMVPALNVIQSRVAVARVKDGSRHRHHRHHRHSHHGYPSSESGYSAVSAPPAPRSSTLLLELGPETAPNSRLSNGPSQRTQRAPDVSHTPLRRLATGQDHPGLHNSQGTFPRGNGVSPSGNGSQHPGYYTGQGTYPRTARGPNGSGPRSKSSYPNGVVGEEHTMSNSHTYYNMNGSVTSPQSAYIERVSGPQMESPPPYYYNNQHSHVMNQGKSTVL